MEKYYCMFGLDTRRVLELGIKIKDEPGFVGPTIFVNGEQFRLPKDLLNKLIDRFKLENPIKGTIIVEKEELFSGKYTSSDDEIFSIVGRDADEDPSFIYYIPELSDQINNNRLARLVD